MKPNRILQSSFLMLGLLPSLAFSLQANAQEGSVSKIMAEVDSRCAQSSDPQEAPYRFTSLSGKFSGQCADTNRFRAIQNLKIENGVAVLNNYHHDNDFWQAQFSIEPSNLDAVYFHVVRFPILGIVEAAHTQIRFKLKNPVQLKSQTDASKTTTTKEVLVSFEAVRPKDQAYNFALGALENYALVGRVTSAKQRIAESEAPMEQYELDITQDEKALLLKNTLTHAEQIGIKYTYNTLRPNCTTEVFDLLDSLPRLQGKYPQFLTVISNDPVAQPAIDALKARQLLKQRVQNYEEEAKGVSQVLSIPQKKANPILPEVAGRPWSLVVTLPNLANLNKSEQLAILKIRSELLRKAPLALQGLGSAMMKEAGGDSSAIIARSLAIIQAQLTDVLRSVNDSLPNTPQGMGLYLVPYNAPATITPLKGMKIPAALPFSIVDAMVDDSIPKSKESYYWISEGLRSAGDSGSKGKLPAYFAGSAIRLKLQRDHSAIRSQVAVGLNDFTKPFTMSNSQVNFSESSIAGSGERATRPLLLISHEQDTTARPNPFVSMEFGTDGGLAGAAREDAFATFQILKSMTGSCETQASSAPTLRGTLAQSALGKPILDRLVQGKKVSFHILGAKLDLRTLEVAEMDVRVNMWPLNCLATNDVNTQFRQNANDMIKKLKAESMNAGFLQKLLSGVLRN
jgi:Domain of unknown function (DUF4105)